MDMSSDRKKKIIGEFITLYKSLPEVWNIKNYKYKNRKAKVVAYNKLLTVYKECDPNSTRETVVKKINSLRTNFRKELKKIKDSQRSGTTADDVYVPNLWYFNELLFLIDQETANSIRSTISQAQTAIPLENGDTDIATSSEVMELTPKDDVSINQTPKPKRRKKIDSSGKLSKSVIQELNKDEDEFLIMAKAYAVKLKKLSEHQKNNADRLIQGILLDGQQNQLTRNSTVTHKESHTSSELISLFMFSDDLCMSDELVVHHSDPRDHDFRLSFNAADIYRQSSSPSPPRSSCCMDNSVIIDLTN